ncbi:MAG: sugar phosphate isomerase/epimerase [Clostridia bacterium]|nr:sugar phosphate isomerase/epimerase [Clostridia bacterium]
MLKTGINFNKFGFECSDAETMHLIREAGFDSIFTSFMSAEDTARFKSLAEDAGLVYESIHAPYRGINCIWSEGEKGDDYVEELKTVADRCADSGIGYFTLHCMNVPRFNVDITGVQRYSELGLDRFRRVVEHAEACGVKACFENVEFPQFEMKCFMDAFRAEGHKSLGFTWDVGHEHCYPAPGFDVAAEFGDLMVGTHVHDNFGQKDPHVITWDDDSHLLPFDGTLNYFTVARSLKACGYTGTITLETSKRGTDLIPWYRGYTLKEMLTEAHRRAERIAMLVEEA